VRWQRHRSNYSIKIIVNCFALYNKKNYDSAIKRKRERGERDSKTSKTKGTEMRYKQSTLNMPIVDVVVVVVPFY
jgi:hypothetical protein